MRVRKGPGLGWSLTLAAVTVVATAIGLAHPWSRTQAWPRALPEFAPSPARVVFERGLDSLAQAVDVLATEIEEGGSPGEQALRSARHAYKRVESLIAVLAPQLAALFDGPVLEDEDRPSPPLGAPAGFQVIEEALRGARDAPARDSVRRTLLAMRADLAAFRRATRYVHVEDAVLLDAFRLELARIVAVGLAGFDTDRLEDAVPEAARALDGMRDLGEAASTERTPDLAVAWAALDSTLDRAARYLRAHPAFETLDRLAFIVGYANPAGETVAAVRARLPDARPALKRLWREDAATIFERDAFDASAYAPSFAPRASAALVALGRRLFHEPALSGPATRSCATCHNPGRAFTDGRERPALLAPKVAPRHTPTLLNAGYEPALFDDGRVGSLEAQAEAVLSSPAEMGGSETLAAERLARDSTYERAFERVFGSGHMVTGRAVRTALAAYVRSLSALNSRFDLAARGESALTPSEEHGFTLFMGKARCAICHFVPLFSGTMPPDFAASEPEIVGVPERRRPLRLDPDPGRGGYDGVAGHRGAFRVPTLRNIALTGPYMHNGVFSTLDQVIDFYDGGGGAGLGLAVPGQTLPARKLHLTPAEKHDLAAFLRALTDTSLESSSVARQTFP